MTTEGTQETLLLKLPGHQIHLFFFSFLKQSFKEVRLEAVSQRQGEALRAASVMTKTPGALRKLSKVANCSGPQLYPKLEPGD